MGCGLNEWVGPHKITDVTTKILKHGTRHNQFVAWLIRRKGFSNIHCEVTYAEFNG